MRIPCTKGRLARQATAVVSVAGVFLILSSSATRAGAGNSEDTAAADVSEIRSGVGNDHPWRVDTLTFENAGKGQIRDFACLFTIPNYWPYAHFSSRTRCELPGKLFRARASGAEDDGHHYLSPAFWSEVNYYRMVDGSLYLAWRVPAAAAAGERRPFFLRRPFRRPVESLVQRRRRRQDRLDHRTRAGGQARGRTRCARATVRRLVRRATDPRSAR